VVQPFGAAQQLRQPPAELADRMRVVDAEAALGAGDPGPPAVPDLALRIARAHEQHGLRRAAPARAQHQHRLRLLEPGQVPEVAAGAVLVLGVGVAQQMRRRRQHQHAGTEPLHQRAAARRVPGARARRQPRRHSPRLACTASVADDLFSV
jgi:hypothetical protein